MKKLIKRYLELVIYTKLSLKREIKRLDKVVAQLLETTAAQQTLFDEYSRTSYKTKFNTEHKKYKQVEKENIELKELLEQKNKNR